MLVLGACAMPNPAFDPAAGETDEGDSETGMVIVETGVMWCAEFPADPGAKAFFTGLDPEDIEDPENQDGPPRACRCAHADLDDFLDEYLDGTQVQVTETVQLEWELEDIDGEGPMFFRNSLYTALETRCGELAQDQWPGRNSDNCTVEVDDVEPGVTPMEASGNCDPLAMFGDGPNMVPLPLDGWRDYFTLGNVISYSSSWNVYTINGGFFNSMVDNPEWLIEDGAYIDHNGTDYQFYNVTSGSIVHALGIQSGDIPQTLNDIDVTTVEGVLEAWGSLQAETTFELVLLRGTSTIELDYQVAYTL